MQDRLIAAVWIAASFLLLSNSISNVSSAFVAVAMAQIPVYTVTPSRWHLPTQAPTPLRKILGVIVGFLGTLLLFYDQLSFTSGEIFPHLLALCYALGSLLIVRFNSVRQDVGVTLRWLFTCPFLACF